MFWLGEWTHWFSCLASTSFCESPALPNLQAVEQYLLFQIAEALKLLESFDPHVLVSDIGIASGTGKILSARFAHEAGLQRTSPE